MVHFLSWRGVSARLPGASAWTPRRTGPSLTTAAMLSFTFTAPEHDARHPAAVEPDHPVLPVDRGTALPLLRGLPRARAHAGRELPDPRHHAPARIADGTSWREMVAMDLDLPKYKTTLLEAMGFRLRRNYLILIFGIVLGGWVVKVSIHPTFIETVGASSGSAWPWGPFPWWVVAGGGLAFYWRTVAAAVVGPPHPRRHPRGRDRRPRAQSRTLEAVAPSLWIVWKTHPPFSARKIGAVTVDSGSRVVRASGTLWKTERSALPSGSPCGRPRS